MFFALLRRFRVTFWPAAVFNVHEMACMHRGSDAGYGYALRAMVVAHMLTLCMHAHLSFFFPPFFDLFAIGI